MPVVFAKFIAMHLALFDHFLSYFSPKSLAHYLKLLDADDAKFNEYFWWRDFYARRFRHHQAMCDVCEKLHSPDKETKIYQARPFNITGLHTKPVAIPRNFYSTASRNF